MASKRIAKSMVDWVAFAESVPKHQLPAYRAFKSRSDSFAAKMNSQTADLPKIDFADFRSRINLPGLVDSLEKSYSGVSVPYPTDKTNMVKSIEDQEVNAKNKSAKDVAFLQKEIESLKGLLAKIEAIPGPNNMTYQMAAEYFPDQSRDPVNHPTLWPHDADSQINGSDPHEIK